MVNYIDILAALNGGLATFNAANLFSYSYNGAAIYTSEQMDTAWENTRYDPIIGRPYQEPYVLTGGRRQTASGHRGTVFDVGVFQIDLHFPRDEGAGDLIGRADLLCQYFIRSRILSYNGVTVQVEHAPSLSPPRTRPDWYTRSVSVPFFLYS